MYESYDVYISRKVIITYNEKNSDIKTKIKYFKYYYYYRDQHRLIGILIGLISMTRVNLYKRQLQLFYFN